VLERELSSQRLGREVQHFRQEKSQKFSREFVRGQSPAMQAVYTIVEQVAQSDSTSVLIEGESGTGKELIAHWIHELSGRRDKPMLEVNCAAIPRELWNPSCSATRRAPSPTRGSRSRGCWSWRTAGRSSSTR